MWDRLTELVGQAPDLTALRRHRVHLFAAWSWRAAGRVVPAELRADEYRAGAMALGVRPLLEQIRAHCDGTIMLLKGPEAGARHLRPETRPFRDLDLLVADPVTVQQALLSAGFTRGWPEHQYDAKQHLAPLLHPDFPLVIEVHRRPNCPPWVSAAPLEAILDGAIPSMTGVPGIVAPAAPAHALLIAAHSWTDGPLGRLMDLVDVLAVLGEEHRASADRLARDWGWQGLWRATLALADAVLGGEGCTRSLRTWGRHFTDVRERTVLEDHLARLAGPASTVPWWQAPRSVAAAIGRTAQRGEGEGWSSKLSRSCVALRHPMTAQSTHIMQADTGSDV
jgi:hypothetical protein